MPAYSQSTISSAPVLARADDIAREQVVVAGPRVSQRQRCGDARGHGSGLGRSRPAAARRARAPARRSPRAARAPRSARAASPRESWKLRSARAICSTSRGDLVRDERIAGDEARHEAVVEGGDHARARSRARRRGSLASSSASRSMPSRSVSRPCTANDVVIAAERDAEVMVGDATGERLRARPLSAPERRLADEPGSPPAGPHQHRISAP